MGSVLRHPKYWTSAANAEWPEAASLVGSEEALVGEFSRIHDEEDRLRALLSRAFALLPPGHPVTEQVADELGLSQDRTIHHPYRPYRHRPR